MSECTALLCDLFSAFWDWLTISGTESGSVRESGSTTIRNLVLIVVAAVGLPLALWRSVVAARQASIAQQDLLNGRYQDGAEMLGSDLLSVRLGGIYALDNLAEEYPEQYHLRIMYLFYAFIRRPSGSADEAIAPTSEELSTPAAQYDEGYQEGALQGEPQPRVREDVQAIIERLHKRSDERIALERKSGFRPDLRGAYLRHANLARTKLDRVVFVNADLSYASLNGASLREAILRDTRLPGAMLNEADLSGAMLAGADLSGVTIENTNLSGAQFYDPDSRTGVHGLTQHQLDMAYADSSNPPFLEHTTDVETGSPLTWSFESQEMSGPTRV